ncbi:thioesterase domain-containing protein [Streptomyces sp. 900105755]
MSGARTAPPAGAEGLSPTKRALLELMRSRRAAGGGVVVLRGGAPGAGDPLVLVHPIGGGVFCYAELSRRLPPGRAVWALAADGLLDGTGPEPTLAELARHYRKLLAAEGLRTPAAVAGWSFGGVVAHEMARQWSAGTDRPAPPVVLIDSAPWPEGAGAWTPAETLRAFVEDLLGWSGTEEHPALTPATWELPAADALASAMSQLRLNGQDLGLSAADLHVKYRVFARATRVMRAHRPARHTGPVTMIRAADSPARPEPWAALCEGPDLDVVTVPGDHFGVLRDPVVRRVAEVVAAALAAI